MDLLPKPFITNPMLYPYNQEMNTYCDQVADLGETVRMKISFNFMYFYGNLTKYIVGASPVENPARWKGLNE